MNVFAALDLMPHRAIILAEETWISAQALTAWLRAGHQAAEVWIYPGSSLAKPLRQPLSVAFPRWSVRQIIRRHRLPVRHCPRLRTWPEAPSRASAVGADSLLNLLGLQIIPPTLLRHFRDRAINIHPALLPRYRGPCPRTAMLADGRDHEAGGVCAHVLTDGIDEGAIIGECSVPFPRSGGYAEWDARLADAAASLVRTAVLAYLDGQLAPSPQDESLACYCKPAPGTLDIASSTPLERVHRLVDTLGRVGRLVCTPASRGMRRRSCHVTAITRTLGPPTGSPPRVTCRTVELDIADARIRLARRHLGDRLREHMEAVTALRRRHHFWSRSQQHA